MEDTHWAIGAALIGNKVGVLILVLMEDTHWDSRDDWRFHFN